MSKKNLLLIAGLVLATQTLNAESPQNAKSAKDADTKLSWLVKNLSTDNIDNLKGSHPFNANPAAIKEGQNCAYDEAEAYNIERSLINAWSSAWETKNVSAFEKLLTKQYSLSSWTYKTASTSGANYYEVKNFVPGALEKNTSQVSKYLNSFSKIDGINLDFVNMKVNPATDRANDKKSIMGATLTVRFDIRGTLPNGNKKNDRGVFQVTAAKSANDWKMSNLTLMSGEAVSANKIFFDETTKLAQLDKVPVLIRNEAIRRGGFALAIADYNNDKIADFFIGTEKNATLLQGRADGTFAEDTSSGLDSQKSVKTATFADLNNDGWQDIVLVHFVQWKENSISVYHNNKGKFTRSAVQPEKNSPDYAMPAAIGDFDTDGFIDLYVGFPGVKDFTNLDIDYGPKSKKRTGVPHGIYMNNRKGDFLAANAEFKDTFRDKLTHVMYPHSAIAVDYNNDGHQDVVVMDDRGGLSPIFKNIGNGKFEQVADKIGIANYGYGMGIAASDFDNDGLTDIVMTNVDFTSSHRLLNSCITNHDFEPPKSMARGLSIYKNLGNGNFADVTKSSQLNWAGQGAGGAEFVDFDNDGWQDLYVVNGLWSGTNKYEDISSYFSRAAMSGVAWDRPDIDYGRSGFMNILASHNGPVMENAKNGVERLSMAGYQHNRLFRNNRNGTFTEIGHLAGVDSISDGYVVAKADLNKDGRIDLVLRNADPGTHEYTFSPIQVFMNKGITPHKSITIRLVGSKSNRDGIGAKVTAKVDNRTITQELIGNNGAAQSEKMIHIGLGNAKKASRIEVLWPSGIKSILNNVNPGELTVEEAASNKISSL